MCEHDWVVIVTAAYRSRRRLVTAWDDGASWGYRACKKCRGVEWQKVNNDGVLEMGWSSAETPGLSTIMRLKKFLVEEAKDAKSHRTQDR